MDSRGPLRLAALLLAAALLPGCAAARRGGEDLLVVATWPVHVLTTPAFVVGEIAEDDPLAAALTAPLVFPIAAVADTGLTAISAADAALTPAYAPFPVKPLGIYRFREFPPEFRPKEAGEVAGVVVGVPLALGLMVLYGVAESQAIAEGSLADPVAPR